MTWYVVQTHTNSEAKAAENLRRQGYEVYLPQMRRWRSHARRRELVMRPLFPRYLFVRFDAETARWRAIFSTVGVSNLICEGDRPLAVPQPVIAGIQEAEASGSFDDALAAGDHYEGLADHPFPTCFSCGVARAEGDGLRLRPARVDEAGRYAAAWTAAADVDVETVWAALDCPGGWAAGVAGRPMVLGTMTAVVDRLPTPGEPHVVMAWQRGAEGRKHFSGTTLHAPGGEVLARAEATWIAVDPTAVRPAAGGAR